MTTVLERKAAIVAGEAHHGQRYGEYDYVVHLRDVVDRVDRLLAETPYKDTIFGTQVTTFAREARMAAYLHDILEDTTLTEEELREEFPKRVVDAVVLVTKTKGYDYKEYIEQIKTCPLATTVKLADTIANLSFSLCNYDGKSKRRIHKYQKQYDLLIDKFLEYIKE